MSSYFGFGKASGPTAPLKSQPSFGFTSSSPVPPSSSPVPAFSSQSTPRSIDSSSWSDGQKILYKDLDTRTPQRPSPVTTVIASRDSTTGVIARISRYPNPERRSPPISYGDVEALGNSDQTVIRNKTFASIFSSSWSDGQKMLYKDLDAHTPQRPSPGTTFAASRDSTTGATARISRFPNPERRSPPISYADVEALGNSDQTFIRNK
ncbi:unnamed protein product [Sphenostylis stenocarpa]|uniref:Uncharacterized protein n=1 Tax=Sphenostylis stenocarpa TaxID=92480 RepID=A0AA86VNX4_9FABA|nr:unnamed protein product [Sphenostylis stenocarpa]